MKNQLRFKKQVFCLPAGQGARVTSFGRGCFRKGESFACPAGQGMPISRRKSMFSENLTLCLPSEGKARFFSEKKRFRKATLPKGVYIQKKPPFW